jgi:Right handed beta helix region
MRRSSAVPILFGLLQLTGCGWGNYCSLPPSITGQPASQTVALSRAAIFTVAASGSAPLFYQWLKSGVAIPGANQASYVTPGTSSTDSGSSFSVAVSNAVGSLNSSPASLSVTPSFSANIRFVAPTGDDSYAGSIDQPYRTIQYCASTVAPGWICEVRAGTYRETVTPNSGITITSYNFEPVIVDGSDPITGWTPYRNSIYKVNAILSAGDTNQIFVGNEMMTEARWPNGNGLFFVNWSRERSGTDAGHIVDSSLPSVNWTGAKVHLWSGTDPFGHETGRVTASGSGRITIDVGQTGTCPFICPTNGGYYYLFGTLSALDAENEWFYDSNSMTLYFMAPGGVNPNTLNVRSKQRQYAFDLRGKSGVTIQNIAIFASTIVTDESSSNNTLDRLNAQYVSHFTDLPTASNDQDGTNFSILQVHRSDSGIILNGTGNILQNSTIAYSAGAGVALEGTGNIVKNNLIHHVDYIGDYASGIDLDGNGNTVQYNTIYNVGRQGIYITGVLNQDISYNNLFDSMMLSRDGAEIYACCNQVASETRIHHNWIHDTQSQVDGDGDSYALSGVGIDNGSGGFKVDQNVIWNNQHYNLLINGISNSTPTANNILNNTFPDRLSSGRIQITTVHDCTQTRVVDNRLVVDVQAVDDDTACVTVNNNSNAPGATDMSTSIGVGCNFDGCSSNGPPAIVDGGFVTPCPAAVFARP